MKGQGIERVINSVIAQNIKTIRLKHKFSQKDIADMLDMSFQQVQKYESGVNRISASNLFLLSQSLRIPIEDFFNGIAINI